ncbi:hydrolase, partial [Streptomyces sp. NPDC002920]
LAIAFVMIWISYKPQVGSKATERLVTAGSTALPSPSAPISSAPPPPVSSAPAEQAAPAQTSGGDTAGSGSGSGGGSGGGSGSGGGGESKKPTTPKKQTAADAVQALAARSDGRHICYRAYVADRGWQDPVCDGAIAGTTGKSLPIKELNIASVGTNGVTGNAAHVNEGWLTGPKWSKAADGVDMYLGSLKEAVSPLQGFTIGLGDGSSVCQNAHIKDKGWRGVGCSDPNAKDKWIYGGSPMDWKLQLEAVRFTL